MLITNKLFTHSPEEEGLAEHYFLSAWTNSTLSRSEHNSLALSRRKLDASTAVTLNPSLANSKACLPGPQQRSSTFPLRIPLNVTILSTSSFADWKRAGRNSQSYMSFQKSSFANQLTLLTPFVSESITFSHLNLKSNLSLNVCLSLDSFQNSMIE